MRTISKNSSTLLVSLGVLGAALAACGGGATVGGNPIGSGTTPGTPGTPVTASPITGTTSSPSPSGSPSATVTGAIYHPPANGDTFAFAGSLMTTYARPNQYPTPEPTQTALAGVTQSITVTNPATFAGNSSGVDFHDVETDAQTVPTSQTTTNTTDAYFAFSNTIATGNFTELGFTSTLDNGYTVTVTNGSGNGLADILPEVGGTTWTNTAAMTSSATSPDGTTAQETINADGTYTEHFVYPNVNAVTNTGLATVALDGSGTYSTPDEGTLDGSAQTYTLSAPSAPTTAGTITETTSVQPSPVASGATPTVTTTAIPNWIPTGYLGTALATETDVDKGATTIPAACMLAASFGTSANQIVQTRNRLDPLFGEFENEIVTTYVMKTIGPVCTQVNDVTTDYYDFSGQGVNTKETVNFTGVPQQITTTLETISLQSQKLNNAARRNESARVALVESRIVATRTIRHLKKLEAMLGARHALRRG